MSEMAAFNVTIKQIHKARCCGGHYMSLHGHISWQCFRKLLVLPGFMISTFVNACSATLSQVSRRNMLSSAAVNSLGDMVSPCRTLLLVLILVLSSCRLTVIELLV